MNPSSPEFRILRATDARSLRDLRHRAIQECPEHFGTPPAIELARGVAYYRRQLLGTMIRGSSHILGAWCGDDLAGMAGIRHRQTPTESYGLIYSMYLVPEMRGSGYGRMMLDRAQDLLRTQWNLNRFQMNVEIHNLPALTLYQSCGFHILRTDTSAFRIGGIDFDIHLLEKREESASVRPIS